MKPIRRYPRAPVSVETQVQVSKGGTSMSMQGRVVVLGAGGAFLELRDDFPVGTLLGVQFTLPSAAAPVACPAIVRSRHEGQGVGVEFLDLSLQDRERIALFVAKQTRSDDPTCPACGRGAKPEPRLADGRAWRECQGCGYLWESLRRATAVHRVLAADDGARLIDEPKPPRGVARAPRYRISVAVRIGRAGGSEWREGATENLSETGVLFRVQAWDAPTGAVTLLFDVADVRIGCHGDVVRTADAGDHRVVAAMLGNCHLTPK